MFGPASLTRQKRKHLYYWTAPETLGCSICNSTSLCFWENLKVGCSFRLCDTAVYMGYTLDRRWLAFSTDSSAVDTKLIRDNNSFADEWFLKKETDPHVTIGYFYAWKERQYKPLFWALVIISVTIFSTFTFSVKNLNQNYTKNNH